MDNNPSDRNQNNPKKSPANNYNNIDTILRNTFSASECEYIATNENLKLLDTFIQEHKNGNFNYLNSMLRQEHIKDLLSNKKLTIENMIKKYEEEINNFFKELECNVSETLSAIYTDTPYDPPIVFTVNDHDDILYSDVDSDVDNDINTVNGDHTVATDDSPSG
jgi:hypothetical protein